MFSNIFFLCVSMYMFKNLVKIRTCYYKFLVECMPFYKFPWVWKCSCFREILLVFMFSNILNMYSHVFHMFA